MFNEATFLEILLPSSGNVKDYIAYLKEICGTQTETIKLTDKTKLRNVTN